MYTITQTHAHVHSHTAIHTQAHSLTHSLTHIDDGGVTRWRRAGVPLPAGGRQDRYQLRLPHCCHDGTGTRACPEGSKGTDMHQEHHILVY